MSKAIGLVEFRTVSSGVNAVDTMVKNSEVDIIVADSVCPGKYYGLITGSISAVQSAVEAASATNSDKLIDSFVLGNPSDDIYPAIYGTSEVKEYKALGIIETYSIASAIVAADTASKTSEVKLIELRLAKGLCGKSFLYLTGEVAAVSMAIERAKNEMKDEGNFLDSVVIASPDKKVWDKIL